MRSSRNIPTRLIPTPKEEPEFMTLAPDMTNVQIYNQVVIVLDYIERYVDSITIKELNAYLKFICKAKKAYLLNDRKLFSSPK